MIMSINYIKENLKKIDHDNLIAFLFDLVIRGGLDNVEDYDMTKEYHKNEKIYIKDEKGTHHIYKCEVENTTVGQIVPDEWIDLLQSFRKPIITEETIVAHVDVKEEVIISTEPNQVEFVLSTSGVEDGDYTIVVFHPELGRLSQSDYVIVGKTIILNDPVNVIGDKLIVDLFGNN